MFGYMCMKYRRLFFLVLFCMLPPWSGLAFDLGETAQLHGFVSQGYMQSSNNNFLTPSRSGSYEFTDLAINANWSILSDLRIGGQLFFRNLGDYSEDRVIVDWALLDYQPFEWGGIRLGKIKMPHGLYNENRDSDFLLPLIFLPQSIYDESRRDSMLAYLGGGIYGNIPAGDWGDVDYHLFVGETRYPDDSILAEGTTNSLLSNITNNNKKPPAARNPLLPSDLLSADRKNEELYGGSLIFNSSDGDLRLGFSLLHSKNCIYVNGSSVPLTKNTVRSRFVLSLEYSWNDWVFAGEYGESDRRTITAGVVSQNGPSQSWYLLASYAPFERWTFSVLYDEFYRMKFDKDGETRPQVADYMGWRKDFGVAVRYDLRDDFVIKAEYHIIDGGAMQLGVLNPTVDRFWNYFAAKLTYSF